MILLAIDIAPTPDNLIDQAIRWWGPAGLIIAVLAIVVVYLNRRMEKIQDARILENRENAEKNAALARDLGLTLKDLTYAVQSLRDVILVRQAGGG